MNKITEIAVNGTTDPMQNVLECLFGKEYEIFVSDEILELMKKEHSYTMTPRGKDEVYNFHKRWRGTHTVSSFTVVTTKMDGNKVSQLECTTEIGLVETNEDLSAVAPKKKVYITLKEEES